LQRLEAALASRDSLTPKRVKAGLWLWLGVLRQFRDPVESVRGLRRSVALHRKVGDAFGTAYSLIRLALSLARTGRLEFAQEALDAAIPLLANVSVPTAMAPYFHVSSFVRKLSGDLEGARDHCQKALSLYWTAGAFQGARDMTGSLADTNWALGALDAALAGFREIIDVMRTSNRTTTLGLGVALTNLAGVLTELGRLEEALATAREGLALRKDVGYVWGALDHLALRAALAGKFAEAARLAGYVDSVFAAKKTLRQPNEARARARLNEVLRDRLDADELMSLLAAGATITEEAACRLALCD
jgi:tetratricopeptide (TPR) repeat protein